ncbi:ArnT family glycosyltransferase [Candidatus Latescibacterota bacterium]
MPKKTVFSINTYTLILVFIFILNALLKWRFFCGLVQADDFSYGVYSFSMFRIPLPWDMTMDFRVLRNALLLPVAILLRFLPPVELAVILYPMALSFGTVLLVYLIGRELYGIHAGLLAAFVTATFPGDVIFGTMLLPDIAAPFFISLGVWSYIRAESEKGRMTKLWYLITGFSVFLAFNTRENSYYFLLFFLPFALDIRRWKQGFYMIGIGFTVPVFILYGIYFIKSGDFLFNLHLAQHYREPLIESGYIPENSTNWYRILFYMVPGFFRKGFMSQMYGYTFYAGLPCLVYTSVKALRKRKRSMLIAPWWFLVVFIFLEYGTISFSSYQMMLKLPRFLLTMTPAMALGFGVVLTDAFGLGNSRIHDLKKFRFRRISGILAVGIMSWLIYTSYGLMRYQKLSRDANMRFFRRGYFEVLKDRPNKPIYGTGGWWFNKLSFYYLPDIRYADMPWRRSDMLRDLKAVKNTEELAGSYIILDRRHFSGNNDLRIKHSYDEFGSFAKVPPKEWNLLDSREGVEIYEVPDGWTYDEPEGRELVLNALLYALKTGDGTLFFNCFHPDFLGQISREKLGELIQILTGDNNSERLELFTEKIEYKEHNGIWKILFIID